MTIHKEGNKILIGLFIILSGINALLFWKYPDMMIARQVFGVLSILFYLLVLQFFRNPTVKIVAKDDEVLAPAEGKVVVIEKVEEPEYFQGERIQISIFMSPLNGGYC